MTSSLRDALRLSGALDQFQPVAPEPRPGRNDTRSRSERGAQRGDQRSERGPQRGEQRGDRGGRPGGKPARPTGRPGAGAPASRRAPAKAGQGATGDIDLAKAYALRAQSEQRERERRLAAEREQAERRRVQRQQVLDLLEGATLNRDDAETVRNFEYGGKIRRVYVTDEQLLQVNDGRLGVIQMRGRYLLVERALALRIGAVDASAVAVLVDPEEAAAEPSLVDRATAVPAGPEASGMGDGPTP